MLSYNKLKDKAREFLTATSLTLEEFQKLLPAFKAAYEKCYPSDQTLGGQPRQRAAGAGAKGQLGSFEDKLLFILVYQKTNPLQVMQGLQFGLGQSRTNYWIHHLLPVLQAALSALGCTPERDGSKVATSALAQETAPHLNLDGTERRRQRPTNNQRQKAHYSGKKKAHTDKNLMLANEHSTKVVYLSPTAPGKTHDKKLADESRISYPSNATLGKDTGFQGYEPKGVITTQPKKTERQRIECRRQSAQSHFLFRPCRDRKRHLRREALSDCQRCFAPHQRGDF
jgi:hypothetical protein